MEKSKSRKVMRITISILAALALWIYMEVEISPPVTTWVRDIPVEFVGEDTTLADKGLMLLSGYDVTVDLELQGARKTLWKMDASAIRVVVETNNISRTGVQSLLYNVEYPDNISRSEITVKSASTYAVTVSVGELYTKEVPIRSEINGQVADGYFTGDLIIDPSVLTLRAQRENLLNVSYAKVSVNISGATNTLVETVEYTLYDYNDVPVENAEIRPSTNLIQVTLPVRTMKEVPLQVELAGTEHTESVSVEIFPATIHLVGEADALAGIKSIVLDKIYVEDLVTGMNGPFSYTIKLPAGVSERDGVSEAVVSVAVNGTTEGQLSLDTVNCEGVAAGLRAVAEVPLLVRIWGTEETVAAAMPEEVLARVDLSGITAAGIYKMPVAFTVAGSAGYTVHGSYEISVTVTQRDERATSSSLAE